MKTDLIQKLNTENQKKSLTKIEVGDTVRVHTKIKEGNKERIQIFEGVVIAMKHGTGVNGTFTVRKISNGIGVERVFPFHSPNIAKVEVKRRAKVRRAKLNYLRNLTGKKARLKESQFDALVVNVVEEPEVKEEKSIEKKEKSEEVENPELKNEENEIVEETEINPETQEDEAAVAEESVEDIAKKEASESEKVHEVEEEGGDEIGQDESNLPEEEVDQALRKAEDEDTRAQEDKS